MQNSWFSYTCICTTVHIDTCGLTLGVHVCLRIAEIEITNYIILLYITIIYILLFIYLSIIYIIYIYMYI